MALTITTLVDPTFASVRLTVAGGTAPYVIDANPAGLPAYRVRATYALVPGSPTARVAVDGAIPLNTATVYVVTDAVGAQVSSGVVTAVSSTPILTVSSDPNSGLAVVVVDQPPNTWESRSVWWDILDSDAPFVSVAPSRPRAGELVLYAESLAERKIIVALFRTGYPLILRAVCPDAVDDVTFLPASLTDELVEPDDKTGPRLLRLSYQAVSAELGPYSTVPVRTYSDVVGEGATYAAIMVRYADYAALLAGDGTASLGPELVLNGAFAGSTSWSTFWSGSHMVWSYAANTAYAVAGIAGVETAAIYNAGVDSHTTVAGKRYTITGRVRAVGSSAPTVHLLSNTLPNTAQYFQPGLANSSYPVAAGPAWAPFRVDVTIPAGDDNFTIMFQTDGMSSTTSYAVEWDDLSVKERL